MPQPARTPQNKTSSNSTAEVNFKLLRKMAVKRARSNPIARVEMCDAQPMLLRAANAVGESTSEICPICLEEELVWVRYAFGRKLPLEGYCIEVPKDQERLARRAGVITCRVVEVCCACSWNFMVRSYTVRASDQT